MAYRLFTLPSNRTLAKVAVYGAVGCISAVMYMRYKIQDRIRNQEYYREAIKTLRSNPGAVNLLGEPIREMGFDLTDGEKNFSDGKTARFEVAVKGSKDRGKVFFWADRKDEGWQINKLELELKSQPDRRYLVKKEPENKPEEQQNITPSNDQLKSQS